MCNVVGTSRICMARVQMKRVQDSGGRISGVCRVRLLEGRTFIGESTHAAVAAGIMIERAVLLNQDHYVLNVG